MDTTTPIQQPERKKIGRPTLYDPSFCEQVVELGSQGKSKAQIAAALNVDRVTINAWCLEHPEFSHSVTRARELAQAWWEDLGQEGVTMGTKFNANAYSLQVRNRFPEEWRDRTENVVSGEVRIEEVRRLIVEPSPRTIEGEIVPELPDESVP